MTACLPGTKEPAVLQTDTRGRHHARLKREFGSPSLVGKSHTQAQRKWHTPQSVRGPPRSANKLTDEGVSLYEARRGGCFFQMHKTQQNVRRHTSMVYRKKQDKSPETKKNGHLRITYQRIKNDKKLNDLQDNADN